MIDIHSHLIPGVDDGSGTVEETVNMISEARKVGFTDIIMTPHFYINQYEPYVEDINGFIEKLQKILDKDLKLNIYPGMEVYISDEIEKLIKENKIITLNKSKYLLIELPMSFEVKYLYHILFVLQSNSIIPIIAHPERYVYVQKNPDIVQEYIEKCVLIQCNYASILGFYGKKAKKTIKILLKKKYVDFLGSDCHKEKTIYSVIPKAIKKIKKIIGDDNFIKISTENPKKILNNEDCTR